MPEKTGTWRKIARGIWRSTTTARWRVFSYKLSPVASAKLPAKMELKAVRLWRQGWEADLLRELEPPTIEEAVPLGFADEATTKYLPAVKSMPTYTTRERHIKEWCELFGDRPRRSIKGHEIRAQRDRWLTVGPRHVQRKDTATGTVAWIAVAEPLGASAVNQRLRALSNLWTVLDGPRAKNPVREEVPEVEPPAEGARSLPYDVVRAILDALPDRGQGIKGQSRDIASKSKVRLRIIAWVGLSPVEIMRLDKLRRDVDVEAQTVFVASRHKGRQRRGARARPGVTKPLSGEGLAAFTDFIELDCWGPFSTSSLRQTFLRACQAAGYGHLKLRPYDLRHSFATAVYAADGDLASVQQLLNHADPRTTRRYARAAVDPRAAEAMSRFDAATTAKATAKPTAETKAS